MEEEMQEQTQAVTEESVVAQTSADAVPESDAEAAGGGTPEPQPRNRVDKFFGITKSGSNFKTEVVAGVTTFMAMVYILLVNAGSGMFTALSPITGEPIIPGVSFGAMYIATAIGAVAGTLFMALIARMPLAQASGMGINAFIVWTLLLNNTGLTYANCMLFTLIEGAIFVVLTVTGLRKKIFEAIPAAVRHAIPVGIGMFIAFIGMQNAGVIVGNGSTLVAFKSFNVLDKGFTFIGVLAPIVAIVGVFAIAIMSKKKVKGAILWGILGSAVLYYVMAAIGFAAKAPGCKEIFTGISMSNPFTAFKDWGKQSAGKLFTEGFKFTAYLNIPGNNAGTLVVLLLTTALSMCMIDMFDTLGTLYGACAKGNLLDKEGKPIRMERMLLSDAIGTCVGALAGTSTVTTFVESSAGVSAGGKTGFTALVTAGCFLIAMFLSPIAQLIPSAATAPALIWVGVLMMTSITKIDWTDVAAAMVGFVTFIVMLLGYSISKGIGAGMIAYVIVTICTGKIKEISLPTWVITVLFLAMFVLTN
ncbi:MAG: NCS2 family permease [Clostridia bacterium]|nr:NCS2 family permease [Clostridia bacterium]